MIFEEAKNNKRVYKNQISRVARNKSLTKKLRFLEITS